MHNYRKFLLFIFLLGIVAVLVLGLGLDKLIIWDGYNELTLRIKVVDSKFQPVENATVFLTLDPNYADGNKSHGPKNDFSVTDERGQAVLLHEFQASGTTTSMKRTTKVMIHFWRIVVEHHEYDKVERYLSEFHNRDFTQEKQPYHIDIQIQFKP